MLVRLDEMKQYLRVDSSDDDILLLTLLESAEKLCVHVARLEENEVEVYQEELKTAVLYTVAYWYENREEADHHTLTLTLRSLLFGIRKEEF
ncbi:head-tail connector protein [Streptococcus ictaluri]|uniref:DNA packaging protein, QLRG family n=1 Tax=Streptococcus ictaluri 707-05 TaxID=764299 RepID=G5K216_9STRE|nr:head-tail connector protein [Streptococcus ictaluri]EHI70262.1 DNA packaging protein, QLRG family [Streptococcus ictaluri 707-05]QBX16573.1 putative DNA packaging protein [Streptococcus phage Javan261]